MLLEKTVRSQEPTAQEKKADFSFYLTLAKQALEMNAAAKQASEAADARNGVSAWKRGSDDHLLHEHYLTALIDAIEHNDRQAITALSTRNPDVFTQNLTRALYPNLQDQQEFLRRLVEVSWMLSELTIGRITAIKEELLFPVDQTYLH